MRIFKAFIKLLSRNSYRRKVFREVSIRKKQNSYLKESYPAEANKVIIFLIDGANESTGEEQISGGIMSIASIFDETLKLKNVHGSETFICTHSETNLLLRFTQFKSQAVILRFDQVIEHYKNAGTFLVHVPEYLFPLFCKLIVHKYKNVFAGRFLHVNILNQNIKLMPSADFVRNSKKLFSKLTMTTAHERYSTEEVQSKYDIPLHKLSVYGGPERYEFLPFEQKDNLMIVSPDPHPLKESVLSKLSAKYPLLQIRIIEKLSYSEYLNLIRKAKWALTFGEGLDYYFIETVFSGGISFAVFNKDFFTADFEHLETLYPDYSALENSIVNDISRLENSESFRKYNKLQFEICKQLYRHDEYLNNIKLFYEEKYTFNKKRNGTKDK